MTFSLNSLLYHVVLAFLSVALPLPTVSRLPPLLLLSPILKTGQAGQAGQAGANGEQAVEC